MKSIYHRAITTEALSGKFSQQALTIIIQANLHQDRFSGQIGHPFFHFDSNSFEAGAKYIRKQEEIILENTFRNIEPMEAWAAFGRLTHAVQDFYAHSNYVAMYLDGRELPPDQIDPLDPRILDSPQLHSGRVYYPWELLGFIPGAEEFFKPLLPHDSHTWMNLDKPSQGPLFAYAVEAARKRTVAEFERISGLIENQNGQTALERFTSR